MAKQQGKDVSCHKKGTKLCQKIFFFNLVSP